MLMRVAAPSFTTFAGAWARDLVSAGVPEHVLMKLRGWETDAMFRRYAIVDERALAEAVARRFNGKTAAQQPPPTSPQGSLSSFPSISAA